MGIFRKSNEKEQLKHQNNQEANTNKTTIIILLIICMMLLVIYQSFFNYEIDQNIPYDGYAISGKKIADNLISASEDKKTSAELVKVQEQDTLFKKLGKYYVGEEKKKEIDIEFPIYTNNNLALYNLSGDNVLITQQFNTVEGYPRFTVSAGNLYNSSDLERVDTSNYIFIKNKENIYINLTELTIKTQYNTYNVPVNSLLYFSKEYITYYEVQGEKLEFRKIQDIDAVSNIQIGQDKYTYEDFLVKLGIEKREEPEQIIEEPKEENETNENKIEENTTQNEIVEEKTEPEEEPEEEPEKEPEEEPEEEKTETEPQPEPEEIYIKPEVTISEFEASVYSAKTTIQIKDPSRKITTAINFTIRNKGKVFLRKAVTSSGTLDIIGLLPNSKYTIEAEYVFLDEEGKKIQKNFTFKDIETKGIDSLEPIKLEYENGEIFSKKIVLQNVKITSDLRAEAIKGVKKIELVISNKEYKLGTQQVTSLRSGKNVSYETQEVLPSDSNIEYEFKIYDLQGNELKVENSKGKTRTSKAVPKVNMELEKQDISEVVLKLDLQNPDKVEIYRYRYEIIDTKGNLVNRGNLEEIQKRISLTKLDPNQYFTINVYANYDIKDEKGLLENQRIGTANFTSMPLSTLGYLNIAGEIIDLKKDSAKLRIKINEERTDKRLINILEQITINIYNKKTEEIETSKTIVDNIESVKQGENVEILFDGLQLNTNYSIQINGVIKQGSVEQEVQGIHNLGDFTTLKESAQVYIRNQFVTEEMIDFDVKVEDINNAIANQVVRMEIRTEDSKLVQIENIQTNTDYIRLTYNKLTAKTKYIITFYAAEYNEGSDATTFKSDYQLKQIEVYTEPGISGKIGVTDVTRIGTGKNLIDMKSETKWYSQCFATWSFWDKSYDDRTETLRLEAGKAGYAQYYTYDLRDYAGKTITISFQAKLGEYSEGMRTYLQNSKTGANRTQIKDITEEWNQYTYTVTLDKSGYIGFYLASTSASVDKQSLLIKELQVEEGSRKTNYEKYKYRIEANIQIDLIDLRNEIVNNDYYVEIDKNGEKIALENYQEINEENKVEAIMKKYIMDENAQYQLKLLVKIRDRFYTIYTTSFDTTGEIRGIHNKQEFLEIQPNGNYSILNDIDLRGVTNTAYRFGSDKFGVRGKIDFQGYKLIMDSNRYPDGIFYLIEKTGIIDNMVVDIYLSNKLERDWFYGIFTYNNGTLQNLIVNLKECTQVPNVGFALMGHTNRGTITNFVVHLQTPFYGARLVTGGVRYCYGEMKNGYIYGENIIADFEIGPGQNRDIGGLIYDLEKGTVKNVYSLINVEVKQQSGIGQNTANLIEINTRGYIENTYSIGAGNTEILTQGPTVSRNSSGKIFNTYYFGDVTFNNTYNLKTTKLALHDVTFQENILNGEGQFNIKELVEQKYYPQVKMSEKMPNQEYIQLPELKDEDLVDIISLNILERQGDSMKVEMNINNPSGEKITNIAVSNLTSTIISQKYSEGKTILTVQLGNPSKYVSKYEVRSITSQGAYNIPYTRNYEANERIINVDFYKSVKTIDDWKAINKSPTENYRLDEDLDFKNEDTGGIRITSTYTGKIDGDGHTIRNITIPETGNGLFYNLNGEIKNLNIENYVQNSTSTSNVGIITNANYNTIIDNVHVKGVKLVNRTANSNGYTGGLIAYGTTVIVRNSSVTNVNININGNALGLRAGGIVGGGSNITVLNSFVQNLNFDIKGVLQYQGIGGIVGRDSDNGGSIQYCYTTGIINTDAEIVGGIYGFTSSIKVTNNYSLVNIQSESDYIGGIGGYDNNTLTTSTSYNLSLGNIYSEKASNYVKRISGNTELDTENYAYKNQLINGFTSTEYLGATSLELEQLKNKDTYITKLRFEDMFNYDQLDDLILPKVYNTDGQTLVPNQVDNKIQIGQIKIQEVEAEKKNVNTAIARIVVDNPQNATITGIEIENMDVVITGNVYEEGKTYLDITVINTKAYDSYKISKILYTENGEQKEAKQEAKIDIQFFNEINNFEDWQKIDSESAQNYRLMSDIDFADKVNPKINVSIGRLEAGEEGHTLKNMNISLSKTVTGMIKEVKNSLKNITFENITITNSASGNYTGLIVRNIGQIENVTFKDITVTAPKMSYVGMIANNSALYMKGINLNNVTVSGVSYVAGLAGITESGRFSYITANNLNITGTGSIVAGLISYISGRDVYAIQNLTVTDSKIVGRDYIGGVFARNGKCTHVTVDNINVRGNSYVGGISGVFDYSVDNRNLYVKNSTITGTGTYIGGIGGQINELRESFTVNSTVRGEGTKSSRVGGIAGISYSWMYGCGTIDGTIVKGDGIDVGGISGYGSGVIRFCYTQNITVEGYSNVGGLVGQHRSGDIYWSYSNANVTATSNTAGGIVGYLNNESMTGANYVSRIINDLVLKSNVTALTKTGGLVGNVAEGLYDKQFFRRNLVDATLNSQTTAVSMGIGGNRLQNSNMEDIYVNQNATINGEKINSYNDNILQSNILSVNDLLKSSTYSQKIKLDSNYFDYSPLSQGYYPYVKNGGSKVYNQVGIKVAPEETASLFMQNKLLLSRSLMAIEDRELPEITVYPVSANEINVEFSSIDGQNYFNYNDAEMMKIEERVYTFKYDYQTPITITLANEYYSQEIEISPEEVQNKASIVGNEYFYLDGQKIKTNNRELEGEYLNLYQDNALRKDGKVYNVKTQELSEEVTQGLVKQEEVKSIEEAEYKQSKIHTYAKLSIIEQGEEKVEREGQIFIRNGTMGIIDNTVEKTPNGQIVDNYNGEFYETVLGTDGELIDIKSKLNYPSDFKNEGITQIATKQEGDNNVVMVCYNTGRVYVFDYVLGRVLYDNEVKQEIALVDYIKQSFAVETVKNEIQSSNNAAYEESKEMVQKLQENPVEKVLTELQGGTNNETTVNNANSISNANSSTVTTGQTTNEQEVNNSKTYITVYNNETKKYEIYDENQLLDTDNTEVVSETSVIEGKQELSEYYQSETVKISTVNGLILVTITITSIIIILVVLKRRNREKGTSVSSSIK